MLRTLAEGKEIRRTLTGVYHSSSYVRAQEPPAYPLPPHKNKQFSPPFVQINSASITLSCIILIFHPVLVHVVGHSMVWLVDAVVESDYVMDGLGHNQL